MNDKDASETNEAAESATPARDWVRHAKWISGVYGVLVAAALIAIEVSCGDDSTARLCLAPNELGDVLAGVFAPLAFFWLAAAVLIQSQELSAQRRELRLTRQELALTRGEYELSRKVLEAQVEEARRSAEFIGKQTEILEEERQGRRVAEMDRILDHRWALMMSKLTDLFGQVQYSTTRGGATILTFRPTHLISNLAESLGTIAIAMKNGTLISAPHRDVWTLGVNTLPSVLALEGHVSEPARDRIRLSGIHDLFAVLEELRQLTTPAPEEL